MKYFLISKQLNNKGSNSQTEEIATLKRQQMQLQIWPEKIHLNSQ